MKTKIKITGLFAIAAIGVGAGLWQYDQNYNDIMDRISQNPITSSDADQCVARDLALYQMADDIIPGNRDDKMMAQIMVTMIACQNNLPVPNLLF